MSYTVDNIRVPVPDDDLEAWAFLDGTLRTASEDDNRPLPEYVQEFYKRLTSRYPCIMENENGPWSDGPLINNFGPELTNLGISFSRVAEVLPFLISTANDLGSVVFDGQDERFHRPGKPQGPTLSELHAQRETSQSKRPWWRIW